MLPHITRTHFSKGKNTGSTDVSKTFTQRGYKSIIKSISKIYHKHNPIRIGKLLKNTPLHQYTIFHTDHIPISLSLTSIIIYK